MSSVKLFLVIALASSALLPSYADHPRDTQKRATAELSHDKYQAILKVYTEEGPLGEKNRKADEVAANYSSAEKRVVEKIKEFFGKRAEAIAKLNDETKDILKQIKELRNQQKALFERVRPEDKKAANFLLFGHAPQKA